ncbi:MAG: Viral A-type inclusion protein [Thermoanaerobacterium thermosaccharolyticum]|jgi:chromosome segregation ATPase
MKGRGILLDKKGIDITKCLDIFLYTLPYSVLIKPFKTDKNLQKKLAGFRLNEKSSPPKKIVPILRQEILKGNFNYEDFVKEWKVLHGDLYEKIRSMESKEIDERIAELCREYGYENIVSALLIDNRDDLGDIINKAAALGAEGAKKLDNDKGGTEKEEDDINKKFKKLEKEVEKLQDKLIKEEKKNIIEVDNLKKALENKEKEIAALNKKLDDLEQEKKHLEMLLEHIGLEFDKHITKLINDNVSKDKKNENLKLSLNKTLMDLHQDNQEIKKYFLEVKEILSQLEKKIAIVDVGVLAEQSAVSLEDDDYSLLDDLSKMLKNS